MVETWSEVATFSTCPGRDSGQREKRRAGRGSLESYGASSFPSLSPTEARRHYEGEALPVESPKKWSESTDERTGKGLPHWSMPRKRVLAKETGER